MSESRDYKRKRDTETHSESAVMLEIKAQDGRGVFYRFSYNKRIKYLLSKYCKEKNIEYETLRFFFNGKRINTSKTPAELGLNNGDEIDAMGFQDGGG